MKRKNKNNGTHMTREEFRRSKRPFYKKTPFIISIIILIIIIGLLVFWGISSTNDNNSAQPSHKIEKVKSHKKTSKKKSKKSKKSDKSKDKPKVNKPQKVTKEEDNNNTQTNQNNQQAQQKQTPADTIQNAGTYDNLTYDSDWYTFKISDEVKLIKDSNGDAALLIKYNYLNKTKSNQVPEQVQKNAIMLKQDGQQLNPTTATGDNASIINSSNNGQVLPGKNFDGALLVKVNNTTSDVTMYFKNIKTNEWLDSTQPLKLS
ncbi:DUF5067 domain-containing protein [Companilactobacillus halodurans]|uniref:DUF5067 domain-containing protein n=1 Tax=Companilactobacillus halodurans TaxID=2584183 RepID=A0A5P0ZY61_9LACO|nr:DUF5067 domain-containing protein [Companilactobacillus halodurans]MQS75723.1 DUF5067 domain-containing protein [Companilactobacillus halodurans]MQS98033.1 DUF5067 domain-containing protein [Companilactobacillus halodurans]